MSLLPLGSSRKTFSTLFFALVLFACTVSEQSLPANDIPISVTPPPAAIPTGTPGIIEVPNSVGLWEVFEITLNSSVAYANPFTDVDVYADFSGPGGTTLRIYGFHDGDGIGGQGNLWKIRFMTGELGKWSWRTSSTDASNTGLHNQSGTFSVETSSEPGPLAPDPDFPTAWRHANGEYFFWNLGYSIHILGADRTHPGVGGWEDYLNWLQTHRFNGVMLTLQVGSFDACSTCRRGVAPWSEIGNYPPPAFAFENRGKVDYFAVPWTTKNEPDKMAENDRNADFSRFYLPYWRRIDELLGELQDREMIAHIFQYDDEIFWPPANSLEEQLYWNYILRRMGAYWNVAFNDGIDLNEYRKLSSWVPSWQEHFQEFDPYGHPRSSRHGDDDSNHATWRSVQAANSVDPQNLEVWRRLIGKSPEKPVTEDDGIRARKDNGIPPDRFMQLAWWSVLAGPGGFGATWAGAYDPGNWYANLDEESEGMKRVEIRNRFILDFNLINGMKIPFWKLQPQDDILKGENVYASAVPGEHYLIYFDIDSGTTAQVDLRNDERTFYVTWLNPQTGETMNGGTIKAADWQSFSKPYDAAAVLYIGEQAALTGLPASRTFQFWPGLLNRQNRCYPV